MSTLERVPPDEAKQIANIIRLTKQQLEKHYPNGTVAFRGQHAKAHACVSGTLTVVEDIPQDKRRGVFATPGQEYQIWVRYSNAAAAPLAADSTVVAAGAPVTHGGRGMAIKILGVSGSPLVPTDGPAVQDFLLVNHPVFPFGTVEDYEAITEILAADNDKPDRFFAARIRKQADGNPDLADPVTRRALKTFEIVQRIQSASMTAKFPPYQAPPASPVDNQYFSGAPFLFGQDQVMRVRVTPMSPAASGPVDVADSSYLRTALLQRLTAPGAQDVRFDFQVQTRSASELAGSVVTDIEDVSREWNEVQHPFVTVAVIAIPPQDFDAAERRAHCEALSFSPWHGVEDHRPLGGINRLRRAVYEVSASFRQRSGR